MPLSTKPKIGWPAALIAIVAFVGCTSAPIVDGPRFDPAPWPVQEPARSAGQGQAVERRIAPGDQLELVFHSAPELNRTVTVADDGRVYLPFIEPVFISGVPRDAAEARLIAAYGAQLVDPTLDLLLSAAGEAKVFIGGAVGEPGAYALPGPTDALQAMIMAGGATAEARLDTVVLMRRNAAGIVETRHVDLAAALKAPAAIDWFPLQAFDVLYVPRKPIADQNRFMAQYIRNALPLDFLFIYDLSADRD